MSSLPKIITVVLIVLILARQWQLGIIQSLRFFPGRFPVKAVLRIAPFFLAVFVPVLFFADPPLIRALTGIDHFAAKRLADFGGFLGRNVHPWIFLAFVYLAGMLGKREHLSQYAFRGFVAAGASALLTVISKFTFLRARPYLQAGHLSFFNWDGLLKDASAFQSFGSGDVAVVSGILFCLSETLRSRSLRWLLRLLPLATAFARIYPWKHWPSDTLLGFGLGFIAAQFALHCVTFRDDSAGHPNPAARPRPVKQKEIVAAPRLP